MVIGKEMFFDRRTQLISTKEPTRIGYAYQPLLVPEGLQRKHCQCAQRVSLVSTSHTSVDGLLLREGPSYQAESAGGPTAYGDAREKCDCMMWTEWLQNGLQWTLLRYSWYKGLLSIVVVAWLLLLGVDARRCSWALARLWVDIPSLVNRAHETWCREEHISNCIILPDYSYCTEIPKLGCTAQHRAIFCLK